MKTAIVLRTAIAGIAFAVASAPALSQVSLSINIGPPPPPYEVVPVLAPGYVWAPGYYAWHGDRYIWIRGRPIVHRAGYRWAPDRWENRHGAYVREYGHWEREARFKGEGDRGRGHGKGRHG